MNSIGVNRKAKEAAGAIMNLIPKPGSAAAESGNLVMNVEYNHLDGLLA